MRPPGPLRALLTTQGITNPRVLDAMDRVPRERFVPRDIANRAHEDGALPIGHGQTISQPYIVAAMTEAIAPRPSFRVLDVGTGSGYQAAILAESVAEVHSIERIPELSERARRTLSELGYDQVRCHLGDGSLGWPDAAPYDAIIVACATATVPAALKSQLRVGGRLCLPLGDPRGDQQLTLVTRRPPNDTDTETSLGLVRFVPLIEGRSQDSPPVA